MNAFKSSTLASVVLLSALAMTGCANSPAAISMLSEEELKATNSNVLCHALGANNSEKARQELVARNLFTPEEWGYISAKSVAIGMSELAMICSLGAPVPGYGGVNTTASANGVTKQYVYEHPMRSTRYIYVTNGRVSSFQF